MNHAELEIASTRFGVFRFRWAEVRRIGARVVAPLLAVLLFATAALKIHALAVGHVSPALFIIPRPIFLLAIEIELVLAVWLICGRGPRMAWWTATIFFLAMAGVSFFLAIGGHRDCGCLGTIQGQPWAIFAADVVIVIILLVFAPTRQHPAPPLAPAVYGRTMSVFALSAAILILLSTGALFWLFDDPSTGALAWLRRDAVSLSPTVSDVGEGSPWTTTDFQVSLTNHTDRPIRLIGGSVTCWVHVRTDLPVVVPPRETQSVTLRMQVPGAPGPFQRQFVLYLEDDKLFKIVWYYSGKVMQQQE